MIRLPFRLFAFCAMLGFATPIMGHAQEPDAVATPTPPPPPPEVAQPAYEVFRVEQNGIGLAYRVWEEWVPQVVGTPDGGAWAFFTAQARSAEGYGERRLFASRFDPAVSVWLPATAIGNPKTQFGASPVVDSQGVVHLVYSERDADSPDPWSKLVYQRFVDDQWSEPVEVAPHPDAGHQMLASLAVDADDGLHVVWRDQRNVPEEARLALSTNADLLASAYIDSQWSTPVQVNLREAPDVNPAWPHLVVDGNRLVLVWSMYQGTTPEEMQSAARVEWSVRPLGPDGEWTTPKTLFVRESGDAGGRLIDLAADPRGGAVVIYGLYNKSNNLLYMQRINQDGADWDEPVLLSSGDYGYLPRVTVAEDGTLYTVFNIGRNRDVDIGGLMVEPSGDNAEAVTLTPGEGGVTARASIAMDANGVPIVIYMHQPAGSTNVTEIQSVRAPSFIPPVIP